jgi:CheY-like chemotaxis protein
MKVQTEHPILLVEDSPEDYAAMVRAFHKAGLSNPIFRCANGDDALDFLHHRGSFTDLEQTPRPSIILLDLNLPGTDGREVLAEVKADPRFKAIPVIVMTTSDDDRDIAGCYQAGANSYVQKPVSLDRFLRAIQRLKDFWFEIVLLPKTM